MALVIGCIWHGLDALQGTRAKPGNHLVQYIIICGVREYPSSLSINRYLSLLCAQHRQQDVYLKEQAEVGSSR